MQYDNSYRHIATDITKTSKRASRSISNERIVLFFFPFRFLLNRNKSHDRLPHHPSEPSLPLHSHSHTHERIEAGTYRTYLPLAATHTCPASHWRTHHRRSTAGNEPAQPPADFASIPTVSDGMTKDEHLDFSLHFSLEVYIHRRQHPIPHTRHKHAPSKPGTAQSHIPNKSTTQPEKKNLRRQPEARLTCRRTHIPPLPDLPKRI